MSFFDKLKNVLFEDEEEVSEETSPKEEVKTDEVRFSSKPKETKVEESPKEEAKETTVFQSFDEEEFDRIAAINKNRLLERDRKAREEKERQEREQDISRKEAINSSRENYRRYEELRYGKSSTKDTTEYHKTSEVQQNIYNKPLASKEEPKKFRPSPVISPVYGVLGENYKKEDILPRASSEGTLPKIMDVDNVRKKAFGILEQNMDTNEALQDFKGDSEIPLEKIDENLDEDIMGKTIKIDVDDVKNELDKKEEIDSSDTKASVKKDDEALEKDLFNLIDSMYETREDK